MPKKTTNLAPLLDEIEKQLRRQNSLRYIFMQGLMRGLGTALGATVLVALVTSLTIQFTDAGAVTSFMESVVEAMAD